MIQTQASFSWSWLTLRWSAERKDTALATEAAARRIESELNRWGAAVDVLPGGHEFRFRPSWRAGRSWIAYVARGTIHIERTPERIIVTAGASLVPSAVWAGLFVGLAVVLHAPLVPLLAIGCFFALATARVSRRLRGVARSAVTLDSADRAR